MVDKIKNNMSLVIKNIKINIKNEKELKNSFIISIIGMGLSNISFLVLWYYFGKVVGELNGWQPYDIFGLHGISIISYGMVSSFFSGIYNIPDYIIRGDLDKYLLTPKSVLLKISTSKFNTSALGDLLYGTICFVGFTIYRNLTLIQYLIVLLMIILSVMIFYSFSLFCMSISFYLVDGTNVSYSLYDIFISSSTYHGGAYTGFLRLIFTLIVPSLLVGIIPIEVIKSLSINKLLMSLLLTIFWLLASITFFYKSLKKYESSSFFTFGN